jgi:hypothetical protein
LDGVAENQPSAIRASGLSMTEQSWLLMWLYYNTGKMTSAYRALKELPVDGYPDKAVVAAAIYQRGMDDDVTAVLAEHVSHVSTAPNPVALMLRVALTNVMPTQQELQRALESGLDVTFSDEDSSTMTAAMAVAADVASREQELICARRFESAAIRNAIHYREWSDGTPVQSGRLLGLSTGALDDLIDSGLVGESILQVAREAADARAPYLTARLLPELVADEDLEKLGCAQEEARRAFVAGEDWRTALPSSDPTYRRFQLLEELRNGNPAVFADLDPLLQHQLRPIAAAVARSFHTKEIADSALSDPSTWPVLAPLLPQGEALDAASPSVHRLHEWWALQHAKQQLYQWDWVEATRTARECLRTATGEDVRDEALNLLACGLYQQGEVESAAQALEEALLGVDSPDLIVNFGIVAGEHNKYAAARELARLALEASTLELRLTAAKRAVLLWGNSVPGDNEDDAPPESLIVAMRSLSVEPTGLDEHATILKFLSWADDDWLADGRHTHASPYISTPQHRYYIARAGGPEECAQELARATQEYPDDEWLTRERDDLAETLIRLMFGDEPQLGAATWALKLFESEIPLDARQRVLLPVLAVREYAFHLAADEKREGTLKPELLTQVIAAKGIAETLEDPAAYNELIEETIRKVAIACWPGWIHELDAIGDAYNSMRAQVAGMSRFSVDQAAVRRAVLSLLESIDGVDRHVYEARTHLVDAEITAQLDWLRSQAKELRETVMTLGR